MNTNADADGPFFTETMSWSSGGLEDGELDSEKEESPTVAANSRKLHEDAHLNLTDNEDNMPEDFPRVLHRFQEKSMRCPSTDDTTGNELDDYEMLYMRGGSPPKTLEMDKIYMSSDENHYNGASYVYESDENVGRKTRRNRKRRRDRSSKRQRSRRNQRSKDKSDTRENSGGEQSIMNKSPTPNDESYLAEDKIVDRKLEICKFYLTDCCIKSHICHYMHSDFPCKFFYLGLECENEKPCKFLHGKALNEDMKTALIKHIIAAPKAILGNLKRMSKERLESMIDAKNVQLLVEEGGGGTQTFEDNNNTNEETLTKDSLNENDKNNDKHFNTETLFKNPQNPMEPELNQDLQHFAGLFTETQLRNLTELGITCLQQINHLTLAKLTEIGLSVVQINELQKKSERAHNAQPQNSKHVVSTQNYVKVNDADFTMVPVVEEKMQELNVDESDEEYDNANTQSLLEAMIESRSEVLDELNTLESLEENSNLVIDKSTVLENENKNKQSQLRTEDYQRVQNDSNTSDIGHNNEIKASCSGRQLSFSERIDRDIQSSVLGSRKDFDMRMPFTPVTDFVPATEIQASINSHAPIKYKLIEIYIPKRYQPTELRDSNSLDPRLRRNLRKHNNNFSEDKELISSNAATKSFDKSPTTSNTYNASFGSLSSDPRKRKEIENPPKFQLIFKEYLKNSRWYQDQNPHLKNQINQLLMRLSFELDRFHQNTNGSTYYELWDTELTDNVNEILLNIGIKLDAYGNISERVTNTNPPNEGGSYGIPPLLTLNISDGPGNFHGYSSSGNIPPFPSGNLLPPPAQRLDIPKPGLLGVAPGIEFPPLFPLPPPNPGFIPFQREVAERHHWQNCPPGTPFYHFQRPIGPPLGHPFDGQREVRENINENRRRGAPFEERGIFKRFKRF